MSFKNTKILFLSFFRELFVHNHRSLEFRAKLFASMIASNKADNEKEYDILRDIAKEIYKNDEYRIDVLIHTTKEYVDKIVENNSLDIDCLILDIDKKLKKHKRYVGKINMNHLRSFYDSSGDEDSVLLQTRILEYYEAEINSRKKQKGKEK